MLWVPASGRGPGLGTRNLMYWFMTVHHSFIQLMTTLSEGGPLTHPYTKGGATVRWAPHTFTSPRSAAMSSRSRSPPCPAGSRPTTTSRPSCRTPIDVIRCRSSLRLDRTVLENSILTWTVTSTPSVPGQIARSSSTTSASQASTCTSRQRTPRTLAFALDLSRPWRCLGNLSAGHLLVSYGVGLHCVQPEPYWRIQ